MTRKSIGHEKEIKFGISGIQRTKFRENCEIYGLSMSEILRLWVLDWNKVVAAEIAEEKKNSNLVRRSK